MVYAALCFFTLDGLEFMNVLTDGAREYGKYPIGIYGKRMLQFCTVIVPYALIQYYPLLYLLGRTNSLWNMVMPLFAGIFLIPCYVLWRVACAIISRVGRESETNMILTDLKIIILLMQA